MRAVAVDEAANAGILEFGFPLLPAELDDLLARRWDPDLFEEVRGYGLLFPDDFGGARINLEATGVVIYFKDQVARHRAALSNLVPAGSEVEVRSVNWSIEDLRGFRDQVLSAKDWFDSVGLSVAANEDISSNSVHLRFRGPVGADVLIEDHFGSPPWLQAERIGPPRWEGPRADLAITVTDASGQAVSKMRCDVTATDSNIDAGGDTVIATDGAGTCLIPNLPVAHFRISLHPWAGAAYQSSPIKTFEVTVEPAGTSIAVVVPTP